MSRFHSKHEIAKQDMKLKSQNIVDSTKYKDDLKIDINKEYHRINVDSAKKKAVMQRMDYDNFHQMVLGADIKGLRPEEIVYVKFDKTEKVLNNVATKEKLCKEIDVLEGVFTDKSVEEQKNDASARNKIIAQLNAQTLTKYKYEIISIEDIEVKFDVLKSIHLDCSIGIFMSHAAPIEPKLFTQLLILVIYMLNSLKETEDSSSLIEMSYNLLVSLAGLENLKNLKMFINKQTKEALKLIHSNLKQKPEYNAHSQLIEKFLV